ncbi:MAG: OmpP1/FadL family transporter [Lepagella sp.]
MIKELLLLATGCLLGALTAAAEGYQVNTLSARQLGMGHTGVALKLGAESMIFNPAGLGFSSKALDLTGTFTAVASQVSADVSGATYRTHNNISTPMAFNAAFRVYDNLQVGVSFYTPYGSSINWTRDWPGSVLSQKVNLKIYDLQPTVAWRITPKLSIGAGLMLSWGSVDLSKGLVSSSTMDRALGMMAATGISQQMGIDPEYRFDDVSPASVNLKGKSDLSVGFNVGAMYDVTSRLSVGASFRSKMQMKVRSGDATVSYANEIARAVLEKDLGIINAANFKASMPSPYVLTLGASYRPVDKLTLAFDAQLTGWKTYKELHIDFLSDKLSAYDQKLPKRYCNAWAFRLGGEYALTPRLDLRAGMMVDLTPVNKEHFNPETPGMTRLGPSAGLTFRPLPRLGIDVSFMYVAGLGRKDASCTYPDLLAASMPVLGLPAEQTFRADYHVHAFTPSIGIRYAF